MTDRERADRELGFYIALGLIVGAALGAAVAFFTGEPFVIAVGATTGMILATALALGLGADEG